MIDALPFPENNEHQKIKEPQMGTPKYKHVPAAFINAIYEEGSKTEAVAYLQETWNELCHVRAALALAQGIYLEGQEQANDTINHWRERAEQAEAALKREQEAAGKWIPIAERLPEATLGSEVMVWVCVQRKNGKRYVFESWWVNRPYDEKDADPPDWVITNEYTDEPMNCVGWHKVGANSNYDEFFIAEESPEEIIAWMPVSKPAALTPVPDAAQTEDGGEK